MTKRDVLAVALKMLGVYCVIQAVASLAFTGSMQIIGLALDALMWLMNPSGRGLGLALPLAIVFLLCIIYIAIALILLRKADSFAERLVREDSPMRRVTALALKVLGVYCVIQALASLAIIGSPLSVREECIILPTPNLPFVFACAVLLPILYIAIALVLLRKADSFAEKLIREDSPLPAMRNPGWEKEVFVLSMRIIGVAFLAVAIPELDKGFRGIALVMDIPSFGKTPMTVQALSIVRPLVLLAMGAYLLSGAKHIVGFLFRQNER